MRERISVEKKELNMCVKRPKIEADSVVAVAVVEKEEGDEEDGGRGGGEMGGRCARRKLKGRKEGDKLGVVGGRVEWCKEKKTGVCGHWDSFI
jgi:hypothetical protein